MQRQRLDDNPPLRQRLTDTERQRLDPGPTSLRGSTVPRRLDIFTGQDAVHEDRFDKAWKLYTQLFTTSSDFTKVVARRKLLHYLDAEMDRVNPGCKTVFTRDVRWVVDLLFKSRLTFCEVIEAYDPETGERKK